MGKDMDIGAKTDIEFLSMWCIIWHIW